jgi:hypothetical protein
MLCCRNLGPWVIAVVIATFLLGSIPAAAQATGTLSLSLQVQSSISLVFNSYPAGPGVCQLTGSGTNNASLYLGWATQPAVGAHGGCGQYTVIDGSTYQMSSPFYLEVDVWNLASSQYDLRAWVSSAVPGKVAFLLNSQTLAGARPPTPIQTNAYGSTTETFAVQVQKQVPAGMVNATVQFEATAK